MSMCPEQLREFIIRPILKYLDSDIPYSVEAEDLLMMTCAHESRLGKYIRQVGVKRGVGAYGIYQCEIATHTDIFNNYLLYNTNLLFKVAELEDDVSSVETELMCNLRYATAIARVHYYRVPEALPIKEDNDNYLKELARYCKKYYNTHLGKATEEDYLTAYEELVLNR